MRNHKIGRNGIVLQPMEPGVRLFRTWQFQLSVLIPLSFAAFFFFWISEVENLEFELSSEAVRNLWNHHKLSLTLLGLIFPFTALVASHHRSVQAAEQIRQQQSQNTLTNHFIHTEEFIKVWHELGLPTQANLGKSMREIHSEIFPDSLNGELAISKEFIRELEDIIEKSHDLLDAIRLQPQQRHLFNNLRGVWKRLNNITGLSAPQLKGAPEIYPYTAVFKYTQEIIKNVELTIEVSSFLPPNSIRNMKTNVRALQAHLEKVCTEPVQREGELATLGGNLEALLEHLGTTNTGNISTLEGINNYFHDLVCSGKFTDDEIKHAFPWEKAIQRQMHLSDDMNDWISQHHPSLSLE